MDQKVNIKVQVNPKVNRSRRSKGSKSKPPSRDTSMAKRRRSREEILEEIEFDQRRSKSNFGSRHGSRKGYSNSRGNSRSFRSKNGQDYGKFEGNVDEKSDNSDNSDNYNNYDKYDNFDEDRFEKTGLLEARNKDLKSKVRSLEKDLFEKEK